MPTKQTYSEKLLDPRWQKKRLEILQRDNWQCVFCLDDKSTLHIHHLKYGKEPWNVESKYLITLCAGCHEEETENRKEAEDLLLLALREKKLKCSDLYNLSLTMFNCNVELNDGISYDALENYIEHKLPLEKEKYIKAENRNIKKFLKNG